VRPQLAARAPAINPRPARLNAAAAFQQLRLPPAQESERRAASRRGADHQDTGPAGEAATSSAFATAVPRARERREPAPTQVQETHITIQAIDARSVRDAFLSNRGAFAVYERRAAAAEGF
jgi:hypothetical protein